MLIVAYIRSFQRDDMYYVMFILCNGYYSTAGWYSVTWWCTPFVSSTTLTVDVVVKLTLKLANDMCVCTYVCTYVRVYVCTYVRVCVCMYVCTYYGDNSILFNV